MTPDMITIREPRLIKAKAPDNDESFAREIDRRFAVAA